MVPWRYIEEDQVSADYGLATDEFLMRYYPVQHPRPEPTLRLYTYRSHCALVGRFQNMEAELHLENCRRLGVQIGRRPTGGGAILMGEDQLGVCLTLSTAPDPALAHPAEAYRRFSGPLIQALRELGIEARFRPKNDLEVNGRKIAGLGVYYDPHGALLFHASLLVDLDIPLMLKVLNIPREKYSDRVMIRSVRQRLTTVSRELGRKVSVGEIRTRIAGSFERLFQMTLQPTPISTEERAAIERLAREKYRREEWLFQNSPQADMTGMSLKKTPAGLLRVYIALKGETIKSVLITGDFLDHEAAFRHIESRLKWSPLDRASIESEVENALKAFPAQNQAAAPLPAGAIAEAIWKAARSARMEHHFTYRGSCYYPKVSQTA